MINFICRCGKEVKAPDHVAGKVGKCPSCGAKVQIPHAQQLAFDRIVLASPPPLPQAILDPGSKACPYCGEEIKQAAIVCRFCGMNLVSGETTRGQGHIARSAGPVGPAQVAEQTLTKPRYPLAKKSSLNGPEFGVVILVAAGIGMCVLGGVLGDRDTGAMIFLVGVVTVGVTLAGLIGLIPGYIARGKSRHKDIRMLGLVGIVVPFCWLIALIWAFLDKPANGG